MDKQRQAYIYAIVSVLLWSTAASAFKLTLKFLHPLQLIVFAAVTSTVILFVITLIRGKWRLLLACTTKDVKRSAFLGFVNPFLYYVVLFYAYDLLSAQEAVTLNYTWPIMLALLSIPMLGQKIGWKSILAIIVSFFGVFVIATRGDVLGFRFTNIPGALLALGSAVIWAMYWIFNIKDERDGVIRLFMNFVFGSLYIALAYGLVAVLVWRNLEPPHYWGIIGGMYVGLFEMGITFALWLYALRLSRTTAQVSNLIYASPFLSLIIIHFVVREEIYRSTIIGLVFIVAGILMQQYFSRLKQSRG